MAQHEPVYKPIPIEEAIKMRDKPQLPKKQKSSDGKFMLKAVALVAASLLIVLVELFIVGSANLNAQLVVVENSEVVSSKK